MRVKVAGVWKSGTAGSIKEARELEALLSGKTQADYEAVRLGRPRRLTVLAGTENTVKAESIKHITLGEVWEKFNEWTKGRLKHPEFYEYKWRNHLAIAFSSRTLASITPQDIDIYFKRLQLSKTAPTPWHKKAKLLSTKTAVDIIKLIGRLFSFAIQFELYQGPNPYEKFTAPRFDNRVTNDLNSYEVERFLRVLDEWENRSAALAFKLLLFTGKRTGEVFNLTWDRVNFESGFIRFIVKSRVRDEAQNYPMSPMVREVLLEAQACSQTSSPLVFPSETGKPILYRYVWLRIKKRALLPRETRPHDLRHTFASQLISSGKVSIFEMQKLLNVKSPVLGPAMSRDSGLAVLG